jgi:hypothetical protein
MSQRRTQKSKRRKAAFKRWLTALTLMGSMLLLLGHSVVPEVAKYLWDWTRDWGRLDLPRLEISSPVVLEQPGLKDTFHPVATITNDNFRDAKGIEMIVAAPDECTLGDPAAETSPYGFEALMHVESRDIAGRPNIKFITVGYLARNQSLMLRFPVTCRRDIPRFRLLVNVSHATCSPHDVSQMINLIDRKEMAPQLSHSEAASFEPVPPVRPPINNPSLANFAVIDNATQQNKEKVMSFVDHFVSMGALVKSSDNKSTITLQATPVSAAVTESILRTEHIQSHYTQHFGGHLPRHNYAMPDDPRSSAAWELRRVISTDNAELPIAVRLLNDGGAHLKITVDADMGATRGNSGQRRHNIPNPAQYLNIAIVKKGGGHVTATIDQYPY